MERLDSLIDAGSCAGFSVYRCDDQWRSECHVIDSHHVKTIVLSVATDASGWEEQLVSNVVPVLVCLKNRAQIKSWLQKVTFRSEKQLPCLLLQKPDMWFEWLRLAPYSKKCSDSSWLSSVVWIR